MDFIGIVTAGYSVWFTEMLIRAFSHSWSSFIWTKPSVDTAKWEQAYYDEINNKWETNWTMLFTSLKE